MSMSGAGLNGQQYPFGTELVSQGGTNVGAADSVGEDEPASNTLENEDLFSMDPLSDGLNEPCVCPHLQPFFLNIDLLGLRSSGNKKSPLGSVFLIYSLPKIAQVSLCSPIAHMRRIPMMGY
jgi:hypothetical protein